MHFDYTILKWTNIKRAIGIAVFFIQICTRVDYI